MRMTLSRICGLATIAVVALHAPAEAATVCEHATATIVYVDEDAAGSDNGTSWTNAYTDLQDALDNASGLTEIWVADGTYTPATSGRSETFTMADDVHLYGGFDGTESNCPTSRDPANCSGGDYDGRPCAVSAECPGGGSCTGNVTKLSGEITGDNIYHVVTYDTANADVTIDGFVIEAGQADGTGLGSQGGGLHIRRASPKFCYGGSNIGDDCTTAGSCDDDGTCVSSKCDSGFHAGQTCTVDADCNSCKPELCLDGGPTVKNCLFRDNDASNHGAGVNDHGSSTTFDNCVFRDNTAAKGGGVLVDNGSSSFTDCLFEDNLAGATAPREGGALWLGGRDGVEQGASECPSDPAPTITDTTFVGNIASGVGSPGLGGALYSNATAPVLSGCTFDSNEIQGLGGALPRYSGGAIWIRNIPSSPGAKITSSLFIDNRVDLTLHYLVSGGAIAQFGPGELNIDNTSFVRNDGRGNGGALAIWGDETTTRTTCTNCLFTGNIIGDGGLGYGSAVLIYEPTEAGETVNVDLTNCTFVANYNDYLNGPLIRVVDLAGASNVSVTNCILWNNDNHPDSTIPSSDMDVLADYEYSIIEDWTTGGTGNSAADPVFRADAEDCDEDGFGDVPCAGLCDPDATDNCDDYGNPRLDAGSPATDTGDNCAIDFDGDGITTDDVEFDLDGNDRRVDDSGASDGGNTDCDPDTDVTAPMVDRGAYERQCADDSDCSSGEVCCSESCATGDCCDDTDCTGGESCYDNVCDDCGVSEDCTGSEPYCWAGTCVDCLLDSHCGHGNYCCFGTCQGTCCICPP